MGLRTNFFIRKKGVNVFDDSCMFNLVTLDKCNMIHKWLIDNCQNGIDDGNYYAVSVEKLKVLIHLAKRVVKGELSPEETLPYYTGTYFDSEQINCSHFGTIHNYDYSRYNQNLLKEYLTDLQEAINKLDESFNIKDDEELIIKRC